MTTLGYVHHSGRFDRTPEALGASLVAQAGEPEVNVIGVTEVAARARSRGAETALAAIGWGWAQAGVGECAIAYDAVAFELVHLVEIQVTSIKTWSTSGRLRHPFVVPLALLRSRSDGKTYLISVGHTPSHVETPHGLRPGTHRTAQHKAGLKGWNTAVRRHIKLWRPTGGTVISMDLNLNVDKAWVRTYLKRSFPAFALVRDGRMVGTEGSRTIDIVLIGRRLRPLAWFKGKHIRVVSAPDSDHRSVFTRLTRRR